ncbi:MAG: EF-Tu/IF-2/RF-3 family GTPase [Firmicutes bacterium]|nr:EF-Tu/IF-2/RF-3 family GTPase [Bacillota bacterium]
MKCKYCRTKLPDNANFCGFCGAHFDNNIPTEIKNEPINVIVNEFQNKDFYMKVDDVFTIAERGTVITGIIERGKISVGDWVEISADNNAIKAKIIGIEAFRKRLTTASVNEPAEHVGLLLDKVKKTEFYRGQIVRKI